MPDQKDAFISYSTRDTERAQRVCDLLEQQGLTCWIAPRDVRRGYEYKAEIVNGIENSRLMVLLLSKNANESKHVHREVNIADESGKPILPVRLEKINPSANLKYVLSAQQYFEALEETFEKEIRLLAEAIKERAGKTLKPSPEKDSVTSPKIAKSGKRNQDRQDNTAKTPAAIPQPEDKKLKAIPWRYIGIGSVLVIALIVLMAKSGGKQPETIRDDQKVSSSKPVLIPPKELFSESTSSRTPLQKFQLMNREVPKKLSVAPKLNEFVGNPSKPILKSPEELFSPSAAPQLKNQGLRPLPIPGMVWIPGGTFMMGSPERVGNIDEHPQHEVTVKGFYMDRTEITQAEYERVMGTNPSRFKECPDCPVENVSWIDANAYCKKVGNRLPTEAEWEYAARARSTTKYYWGNEMDDEFAWYLSNSAGKTHPVARGKKSNAFGLYDMSGNIWEWCSDWYDSTYYQQKISDNPGGPESVERRVIRGGSWYDNQSGMRCAVRNKLNPNHRSDIIGLRCVR
jgi:formylglycine-generating enzyme required for sulfatase activity